MNISRRVKEDQNLWNFIFSIFFFVVLVAAVYELHQLLGYYPSSVPPFDVLLMAFATFRVTRLVVYDKIARWFRELWADAVEYEEGGVTYVEIRPYGWGFRHTIHDLLGCPWCIGIWAALVIVFCYYIFAWAWVIILLLALAGLGSLIQLWANGMGWRAENLKLDARAKEDAQMVIIDRSSLGK